MFDRNPIPLFPLPVVVFPGQIVPLHIFEPRYKRMLADVYFLKISVIMMLIMIGPPPPSS